MHHMTFDPQKHVNQKQGCHLHGTEPTDSMILKKKKTVEHLLILIS